MTSAIAEKILNSDSWKWAFELKVPEKLTDKTYFGLKDLPWYYSIPPFTFLISREVWLDKHQVPNNNYAGAVNMRAMDPVFTNIFTDVSYIANSIRTNKCTRFELSAAECYEYYGMRKGLDLCKDYFEDFIECTENTKQVKRIHAIRRQMNKRYLEYLAGKREYKDVYRSHPVPFAYYEPSREDDELFRKYPSY